MGASGDASGAQLLTRVVDIGGTNFRKGVTAPTDALVGTTPSVPALLFDAVLELASTTWRVPDDWDNATDPVLVLRWSLVVGETDADVASLEIDYTVSQVLTTGAGADKANTNILATTTVTTANGLAANDVYETTFTLPRGDATNPIAVGDLIHMEMHLTNLTGVGAIHLLDAAMRYEATH